MTATWTKLDSGEWAVKLTDAPWPGGTGTSLPVTVTARSGQTKQVILGEHVRVWRIKGGRFVDIYRVATVEERAAMTAEHAEARMVAAEIAADDGEREMEAECRVGRDLDPDLAREAFDEMQAEGEMIAREEAQATGWSEGFSSFIDGYGNAPGRW